MAAGCGQVLPPPSVCGQMLAALEPYVPPGARLLDVGSGAPEGGEWRGVGEEVWA